MTTLKFCFTSFWLLIAAGWALSQPVGEISVEAKRISDRVLIITVEGDENVVALNSDKGIVVIDTTVSPIFAAGYDPYFDSERVPFFPRWITNIEMILETEDSTKCISPGHGDKISFDEIKRIQAFIEEEKDQFKGKESAFIGFKNVLDEKGLEAGLKTLVEMKDQPDKYYVLHPEIDQYAYRMMLDGKVDEALEIFKVLAELFPASDIAFDSLGEAYMRKENTEMAVASFEKSLELNPDNRNAQQKLKALQIKK